MLKKRISGGEVVLGGWVNTVSPIAAEIMAASGFDFLVLDAEHSAVDVPQALSLFQAIKAGNPDCVPMVRLPGNDYAVTKRYLDAGAWGVIVPLVNSREEAELVMKSVKYPPEGGRGVGFGRAHGYGMEFDEYMARANREVVVYVQIEHNTAVENIDEILSVSGIDAVFVGPYDLSASMGITRQFSHPRYCKAIDRILEACLRHGIAPGIHVVEPDVQEVLRRIEQGFRVIAYSLDIVMLGRSCRDGIAKIRSKLVAGFPGKEKA